MRGKFELFTQQSLSLLIIWQNMDKRQLRTCCTRVQSRVGLSTPFQVSEEKHKNIIYANVYCYTINDGDSQTSLSPIFLRGRGCLHTGYNYVCRNAEMNRKSMINITNRSIDLLLPIDQLLGGRLDLV